ncbi:LAETG motif-containing sortase-dependent surface protein [Streptomyces sp. 549]|uniref:LAETG motif-containing sortase-dependent surface protein n=1 Tax=Streptomyces sp. 549 TaxID=3049076 RepID=UPI0024C21B11|nr:LAETG motif-containing sortase-dependent surface protein [Streptomyces sp. 549]MDK1473858.1 LAETG motif-containing sortase-dependent surface protein [Streptomyces sp. 549]
MSITRRVTARRLLGTGAAALALCAASATTAFATSTPGGDGWSSGGSYKPGAGPGTETGTDRCQFSLDGTNFHDSVKLDDQNLKPTDDGKVRIKVRTAGDAATCTASLASYLAHGPTFATSGEQVFVDFDTVTVKPGGTDSLKIAIPDKGCYGQIDLYRGAVKFDGRLDAKDGFEHGELPKGPDRPVIKDKLIAAWNGGTKDCTTPPAEEPPASTPPVSAPPATPPPATPTEPAEQTPPATPSEPAEPSSPPATDTSTPTPSTSESTSPPAPKPNGGGNLAETGADGNTGPIVIGAAALLAGGAALVIATRRRAAKRIA